LYHTGAAPLPINVSNLVSLSVKERAPCGVYAGRAISRAMAHIKATNSRAIATTT
jgi:hypothetical protein